MFNTLAIVCGLLSMAGYGLANVYSQPLAKKFGAAQTLFLRGFSIILVLLIGALIVNETAFTHYKQIFITFGLGVAGYLPVLAFTHGVKVSRVSIMSPLAGTSPLITVLFSFFVLNTTIHKLQWLAIVLVVGANIAMSVDLKNWRNSNLLKLSSGIPFALIAAFGWGVFFFLLVYCTKWLGPWLAALLIETGVTFAAWLHIIFSGQKTYISKAVTIPFLANGLLICLGTVAYTVGVNKYNIGIVAALSNSTAIVAAIVATYKFHERLSRKEIMAATAMIAGVVAIILF